MTDKTHRIIKIWQQNTRKSLTAHLATLHSLEDKFDIICIQEPAFDFMANTRATKVWTVVKPSPWKGKEVDKPNPRAVTLVHERLSTNGWTQIAIDSLDVVGVRLKGEDGEINLYNIYNDGTHRETLETLRRHLDEREEREDERRRGALEETTGDIWLGDFNRHHPMWEREENTRLFTNHNLEEAAVLTELLADHGMQMALPHGTPTIRNSAGNLTRPDNVFISDQLTEWLSKCEVRQDDQPPMADHFPIATHIEFPIATPDKEPPRNFRATDWEELQEELENGLTMIPAPKEIRTKEELNKALGDLEDVILKTIDKTVPRRKPSPYVKRWWTKELDKARKEARKTSRAARHYRRQPAHSTHVKRRQARNRYAKLLRKTKKDHYEEWIEGITQRTIWDANKFSAAPSGDGGKTRIPALKIKDHEGREVDVQDNGEKSRLLHKAFFYNPPSETGINPSFEYPPPAFEYEEITDEEIRDAIRKLRPYKAPRLNGISNSVLTHCEKQLTPYLGLIFRASIKLSHYPEKWKRFTTVVLRKQGKSDYTVPNAYRPIALLNTIGKVMASVIKEQLQYHTEKLQLLPNMQFGGRPGCTTTDALHAFTSFVKDAWRKKQEVVALFLDVKGAFPNTVPDVLIHDMRRYGVPKEITDWIGDKMTGHETVIAFDDYESGPIAVDNGADQGCNLSMFIYRFYNASQIEAATGRRDELAMNYADDATLATAAPTVQEAAEKLKDLFQRQGGPGEWGRTHFSTYEFQKFVAMLMSRRWIEDPEGGSRKVKHPPLTIQIDDEHEVTTSKSHKYLGVIMDNELRFKEHAAYALAKGTKWVGQVKRLSKMARGMHGMHGRTMYNAVALPSMLYAADVWCSPPMKIDGGKKTRGMGGAIAKLETVQRKAAIQATGALRTTPTDMLFAHADMTPLKEHIKLICQRAALRIATLPEEHPLSRTAKKAMKRRPKRHPTPLHDIFHLANLGKRNVEKVATLPRPPNWTCQMTTIIPKTREDASRGEQEDESDIKIYTDGSGQQGKIGAAAVLVYGLRPVKVARYHLGPETRHTVYEGECVGQILALRLLLQSSYSLNGTSVMIATDNQATILAHKSRKKRPGGHLIEEAERLLDGISV